MVTSDPQKISFNEGVTAEIRRIHLWEVRLLSDDLLLPFSSSIAPQCTQGDDVPPSGSLALCPDILSSHLRGAGETVGGATKPNLRSCSPCE